MFSFSLSAICSLLFNLLLSSPSRSNFQLLSCFINHHYPSTYFSFARQVLMSSDLRNDMSLFFASRPHPVLPYAPFSSSRLLISSFLHITPPRLAPSNNSRQDMPKMRWFKKEVSSEHFPPTFLWYTLIHPPSVSLLGASSGVDLRVWVFWSFWVGLKLKWMGTPQYRDGLPRSCH